MSKKTAIVIFTRVPLPGRTKTRLLARYSEAVVTELHSFFIRKACEAVSASSPILDADVLVFYTPGSERRVLESIIDRPSWNYVAQVEGSIWERMYQAFKYCFDRAYARVILCGTDIPELEAKDFIRAHSALDQSDFALSPTFDGGYFLIAKTRLIPAVFFNLGKEGPQVYERTIAALDKETAYSILEKRHDIDTPGDLDLLINRWREGGSKWKQNLEDILTIIEKK